jgi:hypothetical protein
MSFLHSYLYDSIHRRPKMKLIIPFVFILFINALFSQGTLKDTDLMLQSHSTGPNQQESTLHERAFSVD